MPTKEDFEELIAGTTNNWIIDYNGISGLNGLLITSKVNGNTLFIPAAGGREVNITKYAETYCTLWTSSLDLSYPRKAYYVYAAASDEIGVDVVERYCGFSIRPVC
jgi:hypothetical protein